MFYSISIAVYDLIKEGRGWGIIKNMHFFRSIYAKKKKKMRRIFISKYNVYKGFVM